MGCSELCCFPSTGYIIGRGSPHGPITEGAGYGSRSVPVPVGVPATSQVFMVNNSVAMVSSQLPPPPIPISNVPSTNVYVPSYGQNSIMNAPYQASVVDPVVVAPVQPYGISSIAH